MAVTLSDIAAKVGVSVSTVSRVLNSKASDYRISPETESLILRAAEELRYRPNQIARGLRLKKTNTMGLVTPDVSNPFFAHIIKAVQHAAHGLGYSLVVCNTDEDINLELEHVNLLFRNRVDGLIAMPVGQRKEHFQDWLEKGRPLVLLDRSFSDLQTSSVVVDNYYGARQAVEHLVANGHRRIAVIQGLPGTYTSVARLAGFLDTMKAHGIPVDKDLIVGGDFRRESGYVETKLVLNRERTPTAIFAMSDLITLGVLQALEEEGLDLPKDVSLVTFDDFEFAPYLRCPVTAVRQPRELMAEIAVKLLVDQMEGGDKDKKQIVLKPELIVRKSVVPPRLEENWTSAAHAAGTRT